MAIEVLSVNQTILRLARQPASKMTDESTQFQRLRANFAALAAATAGFALAKSLDAARTSDAFLVAPGLDQIATYGLGLLLTFGLTVAFELGGPRTAAHGGRVSRTVRAAIRRRYRHGRTRAEIAKVEVGLTISFCAVLLAFAFAFATLKLLLVVLIVFAIVANIWAIGALCRLVAHAPGWSALIGFAYGLVAGYLV